MYNWASILIHLTAYFTNNHKNIVLVAARLKLLFPRLPVGIQAADLFLIRFRFFLFGGASKDEPMFLGVSLGS